MDKKPKKAKKNDLIVILDFGGQYAHLISRRVREQKVYSKVIPCDNGFKYLSNLKDEYNLKGVIFSGGPSSVYEENSPKVNPKILEIDVPILGICYGHQLIAQVVGGTVDIAEKGEYGVIHPEILDSKYLFKGIDGRIKGWTSHKDVVRELPSGFQTIATTKNCPIAAYANERDNIYGIQWHPEVTHSELGNKIFENFLFEICECSPEWEMEKFAQEAIETIKDKVGEDKAIIGVSGGIDSTTAAVLASRSLKRDLTAVFVDHGLMRQEESRQVIEALKKYDLNLIALDESDRFFNRLSGILDPERKRKVVGEEFIRVFEEVADSKGAEYLIQGTIYPDWIESGSETHSETIKSHHNVGGLPSKIDFKGIIEPLRSLYKDEVREIARTMGLPKEIVERQPFPGPGLAVRIIGEVTKDKIDILQKADKILRDEVENKKIDKSLWQYFAVLLSIKSTGVKGDSRDYGYVVALRAVESKEAMTANFAKIPYNILEKISNKISNQIPEVTRVVYDITHKPPGTIEWE